VKPIVILRTFALCVLAATAVRATDLRTLADELDATLRVHTLEAWFPRALDNEKGGFYCTFDREWNRAERQPKTTVFQARMTWSAAQIVLHRPALADTFRPIVRRGADQLARMIDAESGGYFWEVPLRKSTRQPKHAYAQAYAIYALAAASAALDDPALRDRAIAAFRWLDEYAHDLIHGGYHEALALDGTPIPARALDSGQRLFDTLETPFGGKSLNTHLHLLEAFTELFRVWPDALLRERMDELVELTLNRIVIAPGTQNLRFTADWRALPAPLSYGYDVETAFLLIDAATVLGRPDDPAIARAARSLVDHALRFGWDEKHGGLFDAGAISTGPLAPREKIGWVQLENLHTLLLLHERFGTTDDRYQVRFLAQWRFIQTHLIDTRHGGWYREVAEDGALLPGEASIKGWEWKDPYHEVRALLQTADRLRRLAK
jgi:mannobiose 2-epimerase